MSEVNQNNICKWYKSKHLYISNCECTFTVKASAVFKFCPICGKVIEYCDNNSEVTE